MNQSVLLVDRSEITRRGIREMFLNTHFFVDAETNTCSDVLEFLKHRQFDFVLMGLSLNDSNAFKCLRAVKEYHNVPVVFFSATANQQLLSEAIAGGADGFVHQSINRDQFLGLMNDVAQGKPVWHKERVRGSNGYLDGASINIQIEAPLTQREGQVIVGMADGLTNKLIAKELEISYETVKEHVQRILKKIGVSDRTQAAVWAVRNELI